MTGEKKKIDFEKAAGSIFCVVCGIILVILFVNAMSTSWVNHEFWNEFVYRKEDSVVGNLLGIILGGILVCGTAELVARMPVHQKMDYIAVAVGILCVAVSIYWVSASKTEPQGDQENIVDYAVAYKNGDISSLEKGEYVANHQQQLGLITFMRVLFLFFGQGNYKAYQYFSACMVFVLVFSGYKIMRYLTGGNPKAVLIYLLGMVLCVPMYGYTPFVYGELSSTALGFFAGWILLSTMEEFRFWKLFLLGGICGAMVQFRQNTLVCVIGFLIVLAVKMIARPGKEPALAAGAVLIGVAVFQLCISAIYRPYLAEDAKTVPALLFMVMGTNDDIEGEPGWYNDYNEVTYRESGYDPKLAKQAAKQDLREFLAKCRSNPGWAWGFFALKTNIQWNVPMYQCLVMNNAFYEDPSPLASDIYFNGKDWYLEGFMEIYQLLVYGGAVCFLVFSLLGKKKDAMDKEKRPGIGIEKHIFMICVFGGFLFSLMWEAKPRYVFPYFMLMIPCAAAGICELYERIKSFWVCMRRHK